DRARALGGVPRHGAGGGSALGARAARRRACAAALGHAGLGLVAAPGARGLAGHGGRGDERGQAATREAGGYGKGGPRRTPRLSRRWDQKPHINPKRAPVPSMFTVSRTSLPTESVASRDTSERFKKTSAVSFAWLDIGIATPVQSCQPKPPKVPRN